MRFCPKCAGPLRMQPVQHDPKERLVCQSCGFIFYQDPKVSACTIPVMEGKVVMLRRAIDPGRGLWVYPGGFMDRDETLADAAVRETVEECGLQVRVTDLLGVYSYRTSIVVIVVFECEVLGGTLGFNHEASDLQLFAPGEIPWGELAFPSTRDALRDWCRRRGHIVSGIE
jgi:ADP-ribose pyrophosphatase YjhB (NUDIX family)